jgi:hypothetical protein
MRLKTISVKGLFGVFDHEIPVSSTDPVTIIIGPNGFGKTVILRMIAALIEGRGTSVFEHTPFSEFRLTFEDGSAAIVRRESGATPDSGKPEVKLQFLTCDAHGDAVATPVPPVPADLPRSILQKVDRLVPLPYSLHQRTWHDDSGNEYSLAEILERFPHARAALPRRYHSPALGGANGEIQVLFIQANRLGTEPLRARGVVPPRIIFQSTLFQEAEDELSASAQEPQSPPVRPRVTEYSEDVVRRIQSVLAEYAKHSQERDRTFPARLIRFLQERQKELSAAEITVRMAELEKKRERLIALGLLDRESDLRDLNEQDVQHAPQALTIYLGDVEEKLKVFDDIADRIGTLMDIVNSQFKYKRLRIDRDKGFRVLTDEDQRIALEDLSSGEQHELVVLYELLFRAPKGGLILIDEPEISLHVAWQSRFLSDLIGILDLTGAYAIVATHSPMIIGTRSDLQVELKGPDGAR